MITRLKLCIFLLLSLVLNLQAEWGRTADDYIRLPLYGGVQICSDGNGGCWATGEGVGLSHVDRDGNLTWGDEPFGLPGESYDPRPVLADNGDVILAMDIVYEEDDPQNVYLQRINLDQELLWGEDGIQLDTSSRYQSIIGAYVGPVDNTYMIHWIRHNEYYEDFDPRLQLINGDGDFLWGIGGIGLNWSHSNSHFVVSSDQCVIAAQNVSPTPSVEIVKINPEGEQLWNSRFSTLWEDVRQRTISDVESDREGGVILVYEYKRYESVDDSIKYFGIKAMRISGDGDSLWTRHVYERETESPNENFGHIDPIINYAGSGRFFVAWADWPHAFHVVAFDTDGEQLWDEPVDVITTLIGAGLLDAVDSHGGVCYVWSEAAEREEGWRLQQWGQRISADGERLWGDRGRAIQARNVDHSSITTDGNGGIITVVEYSPSAQMINRNGEIGVVLPVSVDDDFDKSKSSVPSPQLFIYPNPLNSHTTIYFTLPHAGYTSLAIYNPLGRFVRELTPHRWMDAGNHSVGFDGISLASGTYYIYVNSNGNTIYRPINLVK
ncbi:T9SS type A sorting domain-containing protein [bacterium]|nr:T9SS type A sorting domain-containing protein [bacterium]